MQIYDWIYTGKNYNFIENIKYHKKTANYDRKYISCS